MLWNISTIIFVEINTFLFQEFFEESKSTAFVWNRFFCMHINVFTVILDQFNASLQNINLLQILLTSNIECLNTINTTQIYSSCIVSMGNIVP